MLQHRVVEQLVRLRHLAVDEPGQVRGRVPAVAGRIAACEGAAEVDPIGGRRGAIRVGFWARGDQSPSPLPGSKDPVFQGSNAGSELGIAGSPRAVQ